VVRLRAAAGPDIDRDAVIGALEQRNIAAKPYLPCIHLQPYYREAHGYRPGVLPVTEAISASTIACVFPEIMESRSSASARRSTRRCAPTGAGPPTPARRPRRGRGPG